MKSSGRTICSGGSGHQIDDATQAGLLIINADDWGRDHTTTDRILECVRRGTVSSVSAMVFMEDSERAAAISRESAVNSGLHLNFTTPFSVPNCPTSLLERQRELAEYLLRYRFARAIFHPGLVRSFKYVVETQLNEFYRLYGEEPIRLDGHHHMHLCANVLLTGLLPAGTLVRRNFSFQSKEKIFLNRFYRKVSDGILARRHTLVDFFFSLPPIDPSGRLEQIFSLAKVFTVEVETHPIRLEEYNFLIGETILRLTANVSMVPRPGRSGKESLS